jgi:hypothetical protein
MKSRGWRNVTLKLQEKSPCAPDFACQLNTADLSVGIVKALFTQA